MSEDAGTTEQHSTEIVAPATVEAPVALRAALNAEPEGKLTPIDDKVLSFLPRPKPGSEERDLAARLNPTVVSNGNRLQCVPFVREETGIEIRGNANKWWDLARGLYTRSRRPQLGAILVMRGYKSDRRGHVAVVKQILDDRTIVIDHANWLNDGKIYLNAPVRDESPKNDWSRVRVWYTPGESWGRRVYAAKGFIYPSNAMAFNDYSYSTTWR